MQEHDKRCCLPFSEEGGIWKYTPTPPCEQTFDRRIKKGLPPSSSSGFHGNSNFSQQENLPNDLSDPSGMDSNTSNRNTLSLVSQSASSDTNYTPCGADRFHCMQQRSSTEQTVLPTATNICYHYLRGNCTRKHCRFVHLPLARSLQAGFAPEFEAVGL